MKTTEDNNSLPDNLVNFLIDLKMVGQLYPWSVKDDGEEVVALLVPLSAAQQEYEDFSERTLTRHEFIKMLKEQEIFVFNNIEDFIKLRDNLKKLPKGTRKTSRKFTRNLSQERRNQLKEHAASIRSKIGVNNA